MNRYVTKRNIIIAASIFVLLIAGIVGATIFSTIRKNAPETTNVVKKPTRAEAKTVCRDEDLVKANTALTTYPNDSVALAEVAEKIIAETDYQYDVNCLYVVIRYNISTSNSTAGLQHLDILKGLYNPSVGYSSIINDNAVSPVVLEETLRGIETQFNATMDEVEKQQEFFRQPEPEQE